VLVKTGPRVRISTHRAFRGSTLAELHEVVMREYRTLDVYEQNVRQVMTKMETGLLRRLVDYQHG
jgi:F-type H+-transporting ATPase subunit epsilon